MLARREVTAVRGEVGPTARVDVGFTVLKLGGPVRGDLAACKALSDALLLVKLAITHLLGGGYERCQQRQRGSEQT